VVLIDAGANVESKPATSAVRVHGGGVLPDDARIPRPRVGVVSIGEEASKGTDLTRDTCDLFRRTGLNFVGNVEGRDFFAGKADVFVCDGFVGNVAIKTMEGMATALGQFLKEEIRSPSWRRWAPCSRRTRFGE